jgi:hypothetical protein
MPQPNDLSRSLVALDQNSTIIAVSWVPRTLAAKVAGLEVREGDIFGALRPHKDIGRRLTAMIEGPPTQNCTESRVRR